MFATPPSVSGSENASGPKLSFNSGIFGCQADFPELLPQEMKKYIQQGMAASKTGLGLQQAPNLPNVKTVAISSEEIPVELQLKGNSIAVNPVIKGKATIMVNGDYQENQRAEAQEFAEKMNEMAFNTVNHLFNEYNQDINNLITQKIVQSKSSLGTVNVNAPDMLKLKDMKIQGNTLGLCGDVDFESQSVKYFMDNVRSNVKAETQKYREQ